VLAIVIGFIVYTSDVRIIDRVDITNTVVVST
jgi:hypothetical protein